MSIARIGTRAAVVGLGVLASLAFTAAPSWAGKGGNSANAALCEPGGYPGALLNGHAEAFKNEGQCTKAAAHGELAGVNIVAGPVSAFIGEFVATYSGFGLKPKSMVFLGARLKPSGVLVGEVLPERVGSNGEFSEPVVSGCNISALVVGATTAAGSEVLREFPPPSECR